MSVWTWVLAGLCVAGALLAVFALVAVAMQALKLRARLRSLANSPVLTSLESLQLQSARFSRLQTQVKPLAERARTAVGEISKASQESGLETAREAMKEAGEQLGALARELR